MRAAMLLVGAVLALPAGAQRADLAPWMTGARLLKLFDRSGQEEATWNNGVFTRKPLTVQVDRSGEESGRAYIAAVHDLTEGTAWCWERFKPAPDTLEEQALSGLRSLPPDQLRRNAAPLIVAIWAAQHPCPPAARRQP